ncbi:hypothetical protein BSFP_053890 [Burkholderia stabilis]|uniref:Uncharacterized protein n=1 Tax=Burkholderia stabilis TaxID=95485 RepID=A0A1Y1BRQ0_9BURK|nr:hypothetical protein BSFP_053890 [Burkholderia stabilis]
MSTIGVWLSNGRSWPAGDGEIDAADQVGS